MNHEMLSRTSENTIHITAEFYEDGYVLRSGRSKIHRYDLDLYVRRDITLDQLLGAVFCGLRDLLQKKYKLDLSENLMGIVYQDQQDPYAFRASDPMRGGRSLRPARRENVRMRVEALRYRNQRRKLADLNQRYRMVSDERLEQSPENRERLDAIVCWQVFHECYQSYANGYPDALGEADAAQVRSRAYRMHPVIARSAVDLQNDDDGGYYGAARHPQLQLTQSQDGSKTLAELGFLSSTRLIFDPVLWHHSAALYDTRTLDPTISERLPYYVCGKRAERESDTTPVSIRPIKPPPLKPDLRHTPLVLLIPLVMLLASMLTISLGGGIETSSMMLVFILMLTATLLTGLVCWGLYWISYKWTAKLWLEPYTRQIRRTLRELTARQQRDVDMMHQDHPPVYSPTGHADLIHQVLNFEGILYGSEPGDRDFLHARVGTSEEDSCLVPSEFPVVGTNGDGPFSEICYRNLRRRNPDDFSLVWDRAKGEDRRTGADYGMLTDLPGDLAREYGWLKDAPVLLDLKNAGAVGLVYQDRKRTFAPLIRNLILDLSFHHAPEHVQMVALWPQERDWKSRNDLVRAYKYLPHFAGLLKDRSAFAFDKKEATAIFDQIYNKLRDNQEMPHVIMFVMEEYGLRNHPLASYLPGNLDQALLDWGITFVFCKHAEQELPAWCASTLMVDPQDHWYLLPCRRSERERREYTDRAAWGQYRLKPDTLVDASRVQDHKPAEDLLFRAFKTISAIRHRREDHNQLMPMLDLFSMLTYPDSVEVCTSRDPEERKAYLLQLRQLLRAAVDDNWSVGLGGNLETPIGCGETDLVMLDLHESADGPNLLIAGERDTGKTTAALTLFCTMALLYGPDHLELIPVDLCDRGLARELQGLPHTHQDWILQGGEREDAEQYLQRLCSHMEDEALYRRQQFNRFGVDCLEDFNRASGTDMKHLFVILDDYEMLARMAPEGMDLSRLLVDLSATAHGLGIHFVVISDGSTMAVDDRLLETLQGRICLRIRDLDMARRICRSDEPTRMTMAGKGRGYRIGGPETTAEVFHLGFGGVDAAGLAYTPFRVVQTPTGGRNRVFFDSTEYAPDDQADIDAWLKAVFAPLEIRYRQKRRGPQNPPPWEEARDKDHEADRRNGAHGAYSEDRSGDARWNGTHGTYPEDETGDARWHGMHGSTSDDGAGDVRWNGTNASHRKQRTEEKRRNDETVDPSQEAEEQAHQERQWGRDQWKERYYRQWNGYPYNHIAPDHRQAEPETECHWVRPDEALQQPVPFGISQTRFLASVMMEKCSTRNRI